MLAYRLLCLIYKSYIAKFIVYRVYIIGLRYRHDCGQFKYSIYVNLKLYLYNM